MADKNMSPLILFLIPRLYFHQDFFFILFCILQSDTALAFSIKKKK